MGINQFFGRESNFSGFSENVHVRFDEIVHKAVLEVDEEGSVAAAATGVFMLTSIGFEREAVNFHCDHGFVFMINDRATKEVLFAGVYRGPN